MHAAPHFVTVFDIGQVAFRSWGWWGLIGLIVLIAVSGGFQFWRDRKDPEVARRTAVVLLFFLFAIGVVLFSQFASWARFRELQRALLTGRYRTVEGLVHDFRYDGKTERFDVGNVEFSYSSSDMSSMFNTTTAGGLRDISGRRVRIDYDGNDIIRLGVAQ